MNLCIVKHFRTVLKCEAGATLPEYCLIAVIVSMSLIAAFKTMATDVLHPLFSLSTEFSGM